MRVYHFVNEEYGLEDLRRRRLKIATLNELNDPFELFGMVLSDEALRRALTVMKNKLSLTKGLLCFSRNWHNPVQWSHYAEKHKGLCLGFEMPDEQNLGRVTYSRKRLKVETEQLLDPKLDIDIFMKCLFTKYAHWRYENEVRHFVNLEERDSEKNMYFVEFSDKLSLVEVIVGAESTVTRQTIREALGDLETRVNAFKARLAFKSFRVVRQRNPKLWI